MPPAATSPQPRNITIAHSPDSDDAFMFYGLATGKIRVPGFTFTHHLVDIETLNHVAIDAQTYDVTAISFGAYPYLQQHYRITNCGGSVGDGYGPIVVATQPLAPEDLKQLTIAVPGELTTAFLTLKLFHPQIATVTLPFDQIIPAVVSGKVAAGLLIHEGQLTYAADGLHKALDLGTWWRDKTGLPLPLGGNAIRRSLDEETQRIVTSAVRDSIQHALDHREAALDYAMQFARDLNPTHANRYIGMYVNERTIDYGADGRDAIRRLFALAHARNLLPSEPLVDFVD